MTEPAPAAQPAPCAKHPGAKATGLCRVCGDFMCPECSGISPGVCDPCEVKNQKRGTPFTKLALGVAILFAFLSGLELLGLLVLVSSVGAASGTAMWNGGIGVLYIVVAIGLWRRSAQAYSWSVGTQGLNTLLNGFYLFDAFQHGPKNWIVLLIIGSRFFFSAGGFLATRLAKPEFPTVR